MSRLLIRVPSETLYKTFPNITKPQIPVLNMLLDMALENSRYE